MILVVRFQFSVMPSQEGGRKVGNIHLESCSQMLKETRRTEDLINADKMCKMAEFCSIYRKAIKPQIK